MIGETWVGFGVRRIPGCGRAFCGRGATTWHASCHGCGRGARDPPQRIRVRRRVRRGAISCTGGGDLCRRLADAGFETHFAPVTTVLHAGAASTRSRPPACVGIALRTASLPPPARVAAQGGGDLEHAPRPRVARWHGTCCALASRGTVTSVSPPPPVACGSKAGSPRRCLWNREPPAAARGSVRAPPRRPARRRRGRFTALRGARRTSHLVLLHLDSGEAPSTLTSKRVCAVHSVLRPAARVDEATAVCRRRPAWRSLRAAEWGVPQLRRASAAH